MKVLKELGLQELIKNIKVGLNSKEPTILKKSGFNLTKTDAVENDTNKLFTGKGAFDLKTVITNAYTSLVSSNVSTLNTSIATKTPHGGYSGSAQQLKNEIDSKLPNVGYGGVHELGRYLDLHLSGSTADYDTRLGVNTDKSLLLQNANGNLEIGPKNGSYCHIYTDRPSFYFNKELRVNGNQVYHTGYKPGKADVGLGSVNNWGASSSIGANSTTEYATTNMVAQVRSEKFNSSGGNVNGMIINNVATNHFKGFRGASIDFNQRLTSEEMAWSYTGTSTATENTNKFPTSNNANGVLSFNTHSGQYGHQLGFSSNGSVYHRSNSAGSWDSWRPFYKPGDWIASPIYSTGASNLGNLGTNGFSTNFHIQGTGGMQNTVGCGIGLHDNGNIYFWNNKGAAANHYSLTISRTSATFGGTVNATAVYNAVWNDYAELFEKDLSQEYEAGDILSLKFSDEDEEEYYKSGIDCDTNVVGVYSDYFGHLIGGEQAPEGEDYVEHNLKKFIPLGLAGRVKPKIIGKVSKGDFVVTSSIPGVGRKYIKGQDDHLAIFGLVVENKDSEGIARVKVKIK